MIVFLSMLLLAWIGTTTFAADCFFLVLGSGSDAATAMAAVMMVIVDDNNKNTVSTTIQVLEEGGSNNYIDDTLRLCRHKTETIFFLGKVCSGQQN